MDKKLEDWNKRKIISRTVILTNLLPKSSGQRQRWYVRSTNNEKWLTDMLQMQALREKHFIDKENQINQ